MKKYIYKAKLIIIAALVLTSCAVDDDDPVLNPVGNIEASFGSRVYRAATSATSYDLTVDLSTILPNSAQVDFTFDDGTTGVARGDQGSNFITITVDMSANLFRTVTLTDIIMFYASAQNTTITVSGTNSVATIVKGDDTIAQMTWGNTTDIDLLLTAAPAPAAPYELGPTTIDVSLLVVPEETVVLPATMPDGDYAVSIVPYDAFSTPIEFTLVVIAGNTANTFTGTVNSGTAATGGFFTPITYTTVVEFARISKSGSDYTVTNQL